MTSTSRRMRERLVVQDSQIMRAVAIVTLVIGAALLTDAAQPTGMSRSTGSAGGRKLQAWMPYRPPKLQEVGGQGIAWAMPSSPDHFQTWAAAITFRPGDCLQFNLPVAGYVDSVPAASYLSCSTAGYYNYWSTSRMNKLVIQLEPKDAEGTGTIYYIHEGYTYNCTDGLKFTAVVANVVVPSAPLQPPFTTNLHGRDAAEFQVGGPGQAWVVPPTTDFYTNWASSITFRLGDTLRFDIPDIEFEVSLVPYTSYEMCVYTGYTWYTAHSDIFTFVTTGVYYFVASKPNYCLQGMRFVAYVYNANGTLANPPV